MNYKDEIVYENENQGQISLSRVTCNQDLDFYGSKIKHNEYIELKISNSKHTRKINHDYYFAKDTLISVKLTPNQFAEMITHLNMGDGTPCTISSFNKNKMEEYVSQDEITVFSNEFENHIKNIGLMITNCKKKMEIILNKKTALTKKEKEELTSLLYQINMHFNSNLPYIRNQFDESIDKAVSEFKQMCDAKVIRIREQTGIDSLQNKMIKE